MFGAATAALLTLNGCAHRGVARIPPPPKIGATETGIASWYGVPYNGRAAASGEIYDMEQLTAAHRTMPFGTWLEVTDLDNGKKVEVRVNDRGPFARGRILDLSLAAAREIEMLGPGTARVRLKVIAAPVRNPVSDPVKSVEFYAVQAGAFSTAERAETFAVSLGEKFNDARVEASGVVWRVLVGRALSLEDANRLAQKVRSAAGEAMVVADR
jgi:rare lipoprotein A